MTANVIQSAYLPDLAHTRAALRPLSNKELMQRSNALCASQPSPRSLSCTGQVFIGMFFDGTGNNEHDDYTAVINEPSKQKPTNVVRLYHAYPDELIVGSTRYYRYYLPGVGTPFPKLGDTGGMLGTAMGWEGEPRIIWGLTQIFNAISRYFSDEKLIQDDLARQIANATGGLGSLAAKRKHVFKSYWGDKLKKELLEKHGKAKPALEQINLSVFGFSRGAAEARAFVNWLYALCDEKDGGYLFAGIPLRVSFLGIFDTVASVGIAGGFTSGLLGCEGHQSWASDNMQVHPAVESCVHMVAAHEVRATFPLDSVRIEGRYPPNVKEYVYPGVHSDIGGGYYPDAQGKIDALARIPGYEMYCAALAAGVPFIPISKLKQSIASALVPTQAAIDAFMTYHTQAGITAGPVEDMMHQHMAYYFRYRYQARNDPVLNTAGISYIKRNFFKNAGAQKSYLRDTQQHFIAILAAVAATLDYIMQTRSSYDSYISQPFQGEGSFLPQLAIFNYGEAIGSRIKVLHDAWDNGERDKAASNVHEKLLKWRRWLADNLSPDLMDADAPERDVLSVVDTLSDEPLPKEMVAFFDDWVHDSMAGLAANNVNEFLDINGIGIAKFRRIYFGNRGDAMTREAAAARNKQRTSTANAQRARQEQYAIEAREFSWTR